MLAPPRGSYFAPLGGVPRRAWGVYLGARSPRKALQGGIGARLGVRQKGCTSARASVRSGAYRRPMPGAPKELLPDITLDPDDPEAVSYLERSLASAPVWQMAPRAAEGTIARRDPRLLDFLASARNAPLGELEFDVLAWTITRWYQVGRPPTGRLSASFGDLARGLYGKKSGGKQYALIRQALDNLYNVSIDLVVVVGADEHEVWKRTKRRRIVQTLELRERVDPGEETAENGIELELASWLVAQLDARTITALAWHTIRKLTGISKRLAIYLAAHAGDFSPITAHTERFVVELSDQLYDELGITASRERQRRATVARAAERIAEHEPRYSRIGVEHNGAVYVLRVERPVGAEVFRLPSSS